ncbi:hypothetical protein [Rhodococcus tukisamuensis]|uniref:Phage tail sheath protein n=1 Tax=Rhodococcus tukisamuensis TaxID=168276 RepID=A0A1G6X161_9NOCA|nr:hypothetical protein [Rhodococcus tukisamuensis]SDD71789.1 hypothetical protein SAMN05444580_10652 [Rhodococcus tukisamuensis]
MSVRYIRVKPIVDLFAPAIRAFGNIAIVGQVSPVLGAPAAPTAAAAAGTALEVGTYRYSVSLVTSRGETDPGAEVAVTTTSTNRAVNLTVPTGTGTDISARRIYRTVVDGPADSGRLLATIEDNTTTSFNDRTGDAQLGGVPSILRLNTPVAFTDPAEARRRAPGELSTAIALAFAQSPGPTLVYGVRVASPTPEVGAALDAVAKLDVQLVVLANTELTATTTVANGPLAKLVDHVTSVSNTGRDGQERMGVAMLPKGSTSVTSVLASERMVYIAHNSDQDAAVAVAGTIAGYEPHISMLLKPVNITSPNFSATDITALNGVETFDSGPAGKGVNWLTNPSLIPGTGVYLGEGYTAGLGPGQKRYIDIVRTVDDVSFRLKAQLIKTIGNLRVSRSGLRALIAQMEAILDPLVKAEVLEDYELVVPLLAMLDKDPATLTPSEVTQINNAQAQRVVEVMVAVDYAGAIHRLAITLKFE